MKAKAQPWMEAMLASQKPDGAFGPASNGEWWPRMLATYALRDCAETTADPRVAPLLLKYHRYMADHITEQPLLEGAKSRAGDQIDTIFWLYNRTGEPFLLTLAGTLHAPNTPGGNAGTAGIKSIVLGTSFTDFVYDATVSVGTLGQAGVVFRVSAPGIGPDAYSGYYAGISAETGQVLLGKADNGWAQLQAANLPIAADKPHRLRVRAQGPQLQVFVDNMAQPVITVQDSTHSAGAIGVRQYGNDPVKNSAAFSQMTVVPV